MVRSNEGGVRTWNLFLELPGRDKSLFSPTLREPSLIACEVDLKGSGAASLDVFCNSVSNVHYAIEHDEFTYTFALFADHGGGREKRCASVGVIGRLT